VSYSTGQHSAASGALAAAAYRLVTLVVELVLDVWFMVILLVVLERAALHDTRLKGNKS
jgi:hypothetical protein